MVTHVLMFAYYVVQLYYYFDSNNGWLLWWWLLKCLSFFELAMTLSLHLLVIVEVLLASSPRPKFFAQNTQCIRNDRRAMKREK